jgi:hypothetical protein
LGSSFFNLRSRLAETELKLKLVNILAPNSLASNGIVERKIFDADLRIDLLCSCL